MRLRINCELERLELVILNTNYEILNDSIYWEFNELIRRLYTKLNYLAQVKAYPYKKDDGIYYKYTSMHIYHLKNFHKFLELIEQDKIYVCFNINEYLDNESVVRIKDRGTAFKLDNNYIEELFDLVE